MKSDKYTIIFSKQAQKDKNNLKSAGLENICKKILSLMEDDPFCYPPSYKKPCGELSGLYSRRINRQHRIVYEIVKDKKKSILLECGHIMII